MTEPKHTPGPWAVEHRYSCEMIRRPMQRGMGVGSPLESGHIAQTIGDSGTDTANAFLIAAAPDLLAACEALADRFYDLDLDTHEPCWVNAKAAIAKAKGGM